MPNRRLVSSECHFVFVEDDLLLRELLCKVLTKRFTPKRLDLFADAPSALAHCLATTPDLLITDLRLPGFDGREIIRQLRARELLTRFVVLTGIDSSQLPAELLALGVTGFISKDSPLDSAVNAIERVLAGGLYFSSAMRPPLPPVDANLAINAPTPAVLSEREREIVRLVSGGLISKEIAVRLNLSVRTIEKDRAVLMKKLQLPDLPSLIRWCVRQGLG